MAEIYGLFSGRDGRVRYVGQTTGSHEDRFKQHLRSPSNCLYSWFHSEWKYGYPIESVLLQSCDDAVRGPVERWWMARFPGLLNDRISGQIWLTGACSTAPKIPEITAYIRHNIYRREHVLKIRG